MSRDEARQMVVAVQRLVRTAESDPSMDDEMMRLVRIIVHSPLLDRLVAATPSRWDDLALRLLRALIAPPS